MRKAFGHQRIMTTADKARNVFESIERREREGRPWEWEEYGLIVLHPVRDLVLELRAKVHANTRIDYEAL